MQLSVALETSAVFLIRKQGLSLLPLVPPSPGWEAILALPTQSGRGRQNSTL